MRVRSHNLRELSLAITSSLTLSVMSKHKGSELERILFFTARFPYTTGKLSHSDDNVLYDAAWNCRVAYARSCCVGVGTSHPHLTGLAAANVIRPFDI